MRYCDFVNDYEKNKEDFFPLSYEEVIYLMYYDFIKFIKTLFNIY